MRWKLQICWAAQLFMWVVFMMIVKFHLSVVTSCAREGYAPRTVVVVVEVLFISRFRLRPLMGTRQERPGIYLSNYLV